MQPKKFICENQAQANLTITLTIYRPADWETDCTFFIFSVEINKLRNWIEVSWEKYKLYSLENSCGALGKSLKIMWAFKEESV